MARKFIENKINQIKAEKLAKDPNDPIGKIPTYAFFHIMHHWIWDAAKGLETTHEGLYEAMDTKYMPSEESSRYLELAKDPKANRKELQGIVDKAAEKAGIPFKGVNINDGEGQNFTDQILSGEKTIETRPSKNNGLNSYIGKRIGLVSTGGKKAMVVGYATVGEPIEYNTKEEFDVDFDKHRVNGGVFGFKGYKIGYPMLDVESVDPYAAPYATGVQKWRPIIEPVTYDANGKVIPIEERFNLNSDKISYMPADELADQLGVSGTLPDDMVGKGLSTWMHDLIEAFTKAEKDGNNAKAEEIREYLSSGGAGYALVNKGTGVCWASNYGAVKNLAGMLRSRGTPFRDKIDGDEYCYVAPYTMKGDALVSNVEYANQRIIDIRNWAKTQTPEEIKRFEARVQNWAAKNKQFLYSNFNIKDAKFEKIAGETAESGSFEARKKLMQYLSSEAISKEFNLPSGQYRAYKSIDPAYHGLVKDMETTGAMFHTIILKVNLTKLERATAVQDYRNYQNSVKEGGKKSGSADEKLMILDLVDKGIDVNKTKFVQDYRDYQEAVRSKKKKSGSKEEQKIIKNLLLGGVDESVIAREKGSKAEEYGVDSHPSYDSIINGDVVAYLRNPVAAKTLRPTVFKNFDKYNADLKAKGYDKPVAYAGLETNYPLRGDMDDVKNVLVVSNAKERAAARQHNAKAKISGEELKEIPEIKWKYSEKFAPTPNQILTQELVDQANALQVTSRVGSEEIPKQTFDEYSKKTKSYRDKNEKAYQKFESSDKQFEQIKAAFAYVKSKIAAADKVNKDIKTYNDARKKGTPEKEYVYPLEYEKLQNEAQTLGRAISLYESTIKRKKEKNREEKKLAKKSKRDPILVPETATVSKWALRALKIAGERDLTRNERQTQYLIEDEKIRLREKAKKEADEKAKSEANKANKKPKAKKSKIQENAEARIEAKF